MTEFVVHPENPFSEKTFELLAQLPQKETRKFYLSKEEEYRNFVLKPVEDIFFQVNSQFPDNISKQLKININEYPGYQLYECRFYPQNTNVEIDKAHLFLNISKNDFRFGFYININSPNKQIFIENYKKPAIKDFIIKYINLPSNCLLHIRKGNRRECWNINRLEEWFQSIIHKSSATKNIQISEHLKPSKLLQFTKEDLINKIRETFELLFPMWLIAIYDDPMPLLLDYRSFQKKNNLESNDQLNSLPEENTLEFLYASNLKENYTLIQCAEETSFQEVDIQNWIRVINRKKQAIFYGSPGTGKTFIAEKLAKYLISEGDGFSELVQFHPAYSYEDFIQGIRPQSEDGKLTYPLVPGRFLEFCKKAESFQDICVLIIDEINRANLAQVFGELMYLLEYRDQEIPLAGGNRFRIPQNVRIIGTMNTADRSIAQIDHALRRRFAFIELRPNYDVLIKYHLNTNFDVMDLINVLKQLNQAINDKNYEIGISFFLTPNLREDIEDIWKMEIEPYLEEYFFNNLEKVNEFRWEKIEKQITI
ncbi:AAA family ATPase [Anabaena sp. UHCC 0187]|uniref:McrB family protein n=1 Tax=Anabaena sp. UHCC 0187 TaxID=2590018 RepID=UPI0014462F70|nr:AAA family ATPase [Anabaena sp. UHCC 0187]MTJ12339.1 AAA family ATPase [Anabaena sp. UHCC 0187]